MNLIASQYEKIYYLLRRSNIPANISCFPRRLQDVFKMSSRRICNTSSKASSRRLQDVFKTSYKTKNVILKTSSRRLQYVFTETNVCWDGSSQLSETTGIRKNILLRQSDIVLLRYLRQMKYEKTLLRRSNTDLLRYLRQLKYRKTYYQSKVT